MTRPVVLFVCTGNICRSPMAEGIARDLAAGGDIEFASSGTHAIEGASATGFSARAAAEIDVDIGGHTARQITDDLVNRAERIYGLAAEHVAWVTDRYPEAGIELLDPDGSDIADPYGMNLEYYRVTRQKIVDAIAARQGGVGVAAAAKSAHEQGPLSLAALGSCKTWRRPQGGTKEAALRGRTGLEEGRSAYPHFRGGAEPFSSPAVAGKVGPPEGRGRRGPRR